ncbi:DUF502 domain-containing protein [Rhizobium sp. CC-YZS058]|uniref:DUF502 domain-containing protein n=1 Tax=Rhizobium sp. CC-YZS058 TaxID=3042153 RepID=UPI002B053F63|nr:DUF502 domain-containing protein [Rhizobium sp. CC-YZS058]MEA3534776.1 DUF502 domain-containing protein [Rhizobium sp. CC-YZS058]
MTETSPRLSFATRLRNNFLAGLVICAPIAITIWLTWTFIRWADSWVKPYIPARYNPESYLNFAVPGFGLLIALIVITIIGFLGKNLIGRSIVDFGESIMDRMPLVRGLYRSLKQIFETVLKDQGTPFNKAALIEYPSAGLWSLVFIATDAKGEVASKFDAMGRDMVACFMPPTPVPTAGFLVFVEREKIVPLDMSPEDAAKLVISVGLVTPPEGPPIPRRSRRAAAAPVVEQERTGG